MSVRTTWERGNVNVRSHFRATGAPPQELMFNIALVGDLCDHTTRPCMRTTI